MLESTKAEDKWFDMESVEAVLALVLGSFTSIIGYNGLPVECKLFYSGSGTCFLSGSGGFWAMALLAVGILFLCVGVADLAIRAIRKN